MNSLAGKEREAIHSSSANLARSPDPFQPFSCMRKAVLLGVAMLCIVILSPSMALAQSTADSEGGDTVYEEVLRGMNILEGRPRKSEVLREDLAEKVQRLQPDLDAGKWAQASHTGPLTTADAFEPRPQEEESSPVLAEAPPSVQVGEAHVPVGGLTAGWDKGFYIRSSNGDFEFRPLGILHIDFRGHKDERQINTDDTLATTFDIRRLRLGFEGFMFRDIDCSFEVNIDEDEVELIYAYLNLALIPWAHLRAGQFKEPFSYEVLYPEKYLDFVERSHIATSVGPAEDIGVMVHNLGNPYAGIFEYGFGVFNGEGIHLIRVPHDGHLRRCAGEGTSSGIMAPIR